ncbi:MAG: substrate-binding domain-containing protein [Firmicutes bacterium]|nr:substrate-binding domain-containing protein [Bacillota bacterium]
MKKLIRVMAVLLGVALLITTNATAAKKPVIGVTTITLQAEFFQEVSKGVHDAAAKYGVDILENDPQYDASRQVSAIENFMVRKVDGIIILAVDPVGVIPAIEDAVKAGYPVIAVDAYPKTDTLAAFIGTANYDAGKELGQWTVDYVKKKMGGKANIGIVSAFNSPIQLERQKGFIEEVKKLPGVKIVSVVDGKNIREEALSAGENLIMSSPNLDLVYATGEPAVLGALAAIKSQNATRVKVLGWDLTAESVAGIKSGTVLAMIQQDPYREGYVAVESMLKVLKGEKLPKNIGVPVKIYTKENIAQFK